ncbi:MAG: hypothetical protein ACE5ID_12905, partial [Acidobacteriota bacterium]
MELIRTTKFDFLGKWKICLAVSGLLMALSIWSLAGGINRGIDFAGGTEIQVKFAHPVAIEDLRAQLASQDIGNLSLQRIGDKEENEFLIRVGSRQSAGTVEAAEDSQDDLSQQSPSGGGDEPPEEAAAGVDGSAA